MLRRTMPRGGRRGAAALRWWQRCLPDRRQRLRAAGTSARGQANDAHTRAAGREDTEGMSQAGQEEASSVRKASSGEVRQGKTKATEDPREREVMRFLKGLTTGPLVLGAAVVALCSPAPAAASPPVWSVQSFAVPSTFHTDDAVSANQRINVNATEGTFTLSFDGQTTGPITYNANAGPERIESAIDE